MEAVGAQEATLTKSFSSFLDLTQVPLGVWRVVGSCDLGLGLVARGWGLTIAVARQGASRKGNFSLMFCSLITCLCRRIVSNRVLIGNYFRIFGVRRE